jgi:hypothetical protein
MGNERRKKESGQRSTSIFELPKMVKAKWETCVVIASESPGESLCLFYIRAGDEICIPISPSSSREKTGETRQNEKRLAFNISKSPLYFQCWG